MKKVFFLLFLVQTMHLIGAPANSYCHEGTCNTEYCTLPRWVPNTVYDYTTLFNEKRYWLEINEFTGEVQICYQRLDIYPEYFMTPNIHCFRAIPVGIPSQLKEIGNLRCWKAEKTVICRNEVTGELIVHQDK